MEPLSESIEELLKVIASLKEAGRENELQEHLGALLDIVFGGNGLHALASERILSEVDNVIGAYTDWQNYPKERDELDKRKSLVHEIHSKLYSVLDLRIDINALLHVQLSTWPSRDENVEVDFSQDEMKQLQMIRENNESSLSYVLDTFFQKYFDLLDKTGLDVGEMRQQVSAACKEYKKLEERTDSLALFVERDFGVVSSIQLNWTSGNEVTSPTDVGRKMKQAAKIAIEHTLQIIGLRDQYHITWMIEHPSVYEGTSVGLPLSVALIKQLKTVRVDCYSGFTGEIDFKTGCVKGVGRIKEKLLGALSFGLRRVFLPKENEQEARILGLSDLEIVPVESISDTHAILTALSKPMEVTQVGPSVEAQLKSFEIKCKSKGLSVTTGKDIPYGNQFFVSDFRYEIPVNIYFGHRGLRWVVGGNKESDLYSIVQQLCIEVFGPVAPESGGPRQDFQKWLAKNVSLRSAVKRQLQSLTSWKEETEKNCEYRLDSQKGGEAVKVRQFTNGTLTVTGIPAGTQLFLEVCRLVELALGIPPGSSQSPSPAKETKHLNSIRYGTKISSSDEKAVPSSATAWIGTDESGKGDYFGPLVSAGVCLDRRLERELRALGVKDSKKLSDRTTRELAKKIRAVCNGRYAEVPIPPQTYNSLYSQFKKEGKTLNTLLAWGHARAIEDILKRINCEYALADQFADERFIISKLQEAGRKVNLIQRAKAEEDMAVAAASILARDRFLFYLDRMSQEYHIQFPKGASTEVIKVAKEFVVKNGKDHLGKVAKLHFRTTKEVLG